MLYDENQSKWVKRQKEVANLDAALLPNSISPSSTFKEQTPDLCLAFTVKTKHLRDNLPNAPQSS